MAAVYVRSTLKLKLQFIIVSNPFCLTLKKSLEIKVFFIPDLDKMAYDHRVTQIIQTCIKVIKAR